MLAKLIWNSYGRVKCQEKENFEEELIVRGDKKRTKNVIGNIILHGSTDTQLDKQI